jgi:hypothetical protein
LRRASLIGLLAFAFRYLTLSPLENDHFVMLARAQQVLFGDWPIRNFEDPGQPLFYLLTSALGAIFGHVLATNVVLCIALQAVAASCTYLLARRASGSTAVGVAAAIVAIVSSPRLYNTTKVIVPVISILCQWRYADHPTRGRLVTLGAWTAMAFLLRHDYAVYVATSTCVLLGVLHHSNRGEAVRAFAVYALTAVACALPWLRTRAPRCGSRSPKVAEPAAAGRELRTTSWRSFPWLASCSLLSGRGRLRGWGRHASARRGRSDRRISRPRRSWC